ncbi:uncharacterized protein LOC120249822 [Dioscorea cayenensis subsp. rotundata]|uniref:Uncharacterized protein LOC120249822 n=1 Tax=Dioscorea cayennensis subsp. rotundata TaxID=55577 RepID=A0AB40AHN9_DIOCR|nr:uncharacterized protein LOC120249822 [Dioscorea cayenensis subsp. rotundata]
MSLGLLQGYSSAEEEDDDRLSSSSIEDEGDDDGLFGSSRSKRDGRTSYSAPAQAGTNSILPSALDAFAEVTGPPGFLNNCVGAVEENEVDRSERSRPREKKGPSVGVVLEAKPQLVGIRDHVRSDVEGSAPPSVSSKSGEGKRVVTATNPEAKDAADLLRMCLQCGIPKTYSNAKGMVCPQCNDRPLDQMKESEKKKGSTIKDKEKNKRMKGQSSHATWKSETEMQLRQQFD